MSVSAFFQKVRKNFALFLKFCGIFVAITPKKGKENGKGSVFLLFFTDNLPIFVQYEQKIC